MNLIVLAQAAETAQKAADKAKDAFGQLPPMPNHWPAQVDLLQWAQSMGALTAALLVIAGVVYLGFGVYAYRALVTLNAAVMGAWIGAMIGERAGNAVAGAMVGGFIAAAASWPLMKYAVAVMGGIVGLALGGTIWRTTNLDPSYAWAGGGMGLIFFGMISFMLFRARDRRYGRKWPFFCSRWRFQW